MAEPGHEWVGAHVVHRGDQDLLVTSAVAPLCGELSRGGKVRDRFFLRCREGGPHVRLRSPSRAAVSRACARHPSPPDDLCRREDGTAARRRAEDERLTRLLRPVCPVEFTASGPEHHAYGDGRTSHAVERRFTESSRPPPDRRAGAAPARLTLGACEPDLERAAARFAAVRAGTRRPSAPHPRRRDDLLDQTRRLWTHPPAAPLAAWWVSVRTPHGTSTGLRARGAFAPVDALSPFAGLARGLRPEDPVVLRCAPLPCNRLGRSGATEARLVALTARTLSELHDEVVPR
jgi:hypothetical protein